MDDHIFKYFIYLCMTRQLNNITYQDNLKKVWNFYFYMFSIIKNEYLFICDWNYFTEITWLNYGILVYRFTLNFLCQRRAHFTWDFICIYNCRFLSCNALNITSNFYSFSSKLISFPLDYRYRNLANILRKIVTLLFRTPLLRSTLITPNKRCTFNFNMQLYENQYKTKIAY